MKYSYIFPIQLIYRGIKTNLFISNGLRSSLDEREKYNESATANDLLQVYCS